ncbi:hypothetical protein BJ741DRAFT_625382 [Chytriomyces cf. hyalinus JEL632]|nr:hypothetical protein BJ741DRAFT_625382 [Chytriomyces cf. hyalinus JEL632]
MKDFLADALRHAFYAVGFGGEYESREIGLYSDMCVAARTVVAFNPPSSATISVGKSVSSKLKSAYSIGIPSVRSVGFLYTSHDLLLASRHRPESMSIFEREVVSPCGENSVPESVDPSASTVAPESRDQRPDYNSIAYGRIFEDYRLEALVAQTLGKKDIVIASGISAWSPEKPSHIEAQYIHKEKDWCADVTYSSVDSVIGTSCMVKVPYTNWSAGGEVIYTHSERSGGISCGAKWNKSHGGGVNSILTFLSNPMMGFLNTTYTSTIRKNWVMTTSYDFNTYSYNSDLAVGMAYSPVDNSSRLMKIHFSTTRGLSLLLEGQFQQAIVGLGVMTNLGLNKAIQKQSIGFEVQFL